VRKVKEPPLTQDEEIILREQGGYVGNLRSGWKLGHLYLTNKRLFLFQPAGIIFETPVSNITNVTIEERNFVFRRKNTICISYKQMETERTSKAWIIMANLETWRKKIYGMALLKIDEETVDRVAAELNGESREILWYLWQKGHAVIDELAAVVAAPTHMDILLKIRKIINPTAERIIGSPILAFEKSKIDCETGEKILFSWWLAGREQPGERREETLLDILDEGDHVDVVMELLGVQEEDILLKIGKDKLTISANTLNKKYHEEISLPAEVNTQEFTKKYNNNILEVRLEKLTNCSLKTAGQR